MKVSDPICGMTIEDTDAPERLEFQGKTYFFCSASCRSEFEENPEDYAS